MGWSPLSGTKQFWISLFTPRIQSHILVDSGRYWSLILQNQEGIRSPDVFHDFWMSRIWSMCNRNALGMFILVTISASFYCFLLVLPFSVCLQERQHLRSGCTVPVILSYPELVHILLFCFDENDLITEKIPREPSQVCVLAQFWTGEWPQPLHLGDTLSPPERWRWWCWAPLRGCFRINC